MKRRHLTLALLTLTAPLLIPAGQNSMNNPLKPLRWENRVILYTLADEDRPAFAKALADHRNGLRERHLVLIGHDFAIPDEVPAVPVGADEWQWLRERYNMEAGATELVLIGKDGGVKERLREIDLPRLFAAIDRMPMRRAEMRRQRED